MQELTLEQALSNLQSGGLTGQALTNAQNVLKQQYANKPKLGGVAEAPIASPKISANDLSTPPLTVPEPKQTTGQSDVFSEVSTKDMTTNTAQQNTAQQTGADGKPLSIREQIQNRLVSLLGGSSDNATAVQDIQNELGLSTKLDESTKLEKQYNERKRYYEDRIAKAESASGGLVGGAVEAQNKIIREANRELADIAIQKDIAERSYNSAYALAEKRTNAEFEARRNEISTLTTLYSMLQNDLTESERLQAQQAITQKNQETEYEYALALYKDKAKIDAAYAAENSGMYTDKQLKSLTSLNDSISKNQNYTKTVNMNTYGSNVLAALSNKTGTSDIAAINQFQKIIDEGAVTRDQDVKLLQGAQSLLGQLQTKLTGLAKGEQLSPKQRQDMQSMVTQFMQNQQKALMSDPYIASKQKEASLYGLSLGDTILSELGNFGSQSSSNTDTDPLGLGITPKPKSQGQSGGVTFGGGKGIDPLNLFNLPGLTFLQ